MSLRKNLEALQAAGFDVPNNAIHFARDKEYADRGIRSVWTCKCGHVYESPIPISEFDHGCGQKAKRTWPRS